MNKKIINLLLSSFLIGALFGILIGISIKYPARSETLSMLDQVCKDHGGWEVTMVTITGKISTVTCKDGVELNLKKILQARQPSKNSEPQ
jgi:hypothetical protein